MSKLQKEVETLKRIVILLSFCLTINDDDTLSKVSLSSFPVNKCIVDRKKGNRSGSKLKKKRLVVIHTVMKIRG